MDGRVEDSIDADDGADSEHNIVSTSAVPWLDAQARREQEAALLQVAKTAVDRRRLNPR